VLRRSGLDVAHGIHAFVIAGGIAEPAPWYVFVRAVLGLPAYVFDRVPILPVGMVAVGIGSIRSGALGAWGILPLAVGLLGGAYQLTDAGGVFETGFAHVLVGAGYSFGWVFWAAYSGRTAQQRRPTPRDGRASPAGFLRGASRNSVHTRFREYLTGELRRTPSHAKFRE
jgi:hypothetical protein